LGKGKREGLEPPAVATEEKKKCGRLLNNFLFEKEKKGGKIERLIINNNFFSNLPATAERGRGFQPLLHS